MPLITVNGLRVPQVYDGGTVDANALRGYLLPKYQDLVVQLIERRNWLFDTFGMDETGNWSGSELLWEYEARRDTSAFYANLDGGEIKRGHHPRPVQARLSSIDIAASMAITDAAIIRSGSKATEVVSIIDTHMNNIMDDMLEAFGREAFLDGRGVKGEVSAFNAVTGVITLSDGYFTRYFVMNEELECYSSTGAGGTPVVQRGTFFTVGLGTTTNTITVSGSYEGAAGVGLAFVPQANDIICRRGSFDQSLTARGGLLGLDFHIDDGTVSLTHQGVSRTSYPELNAYRRSLATAPGLAPLDTRIMHQFIRAVATRGRKDISDLWCSPEVATEYSEIFQPNVQVAPGGEVTGGFSSIGFATAVPEKMQKMKLKTMDCVQPDRMYAVNRESFKAQIRKKLGWRDEQLDKGWGGVGNATFQANSNAFFYEGTITGSMQLQCTHPHRNGLLQRVQYQGNHLLLY